MRTERARMGQPRFGRCSRSISRKGGPAPSGADHGAGLCADHGRCSRFPRGKQVASYLGLIPREDGSGGRQRLGAIWKQGNRICGCCWWKRRRPTVRLDPDFGKSISIAATEAESRGQGGGGAQVGGSTVLDAAHGDAVSGSRSHREQPAGAPGRRKLDRGIDWALSHPRGRCKRRRRNAPWKTETFSTFAPPAQRRDVRIEESWPRSRPNRWLVERSFHRKMIQREISRVLVLNLSGKTSGAPALPRTILPLTPPSLLSRGTLGSERRERVGQPHSTCYTVTCDWESCPFFVARRDSFPLSRLFYAHSLRQRVWRRWICARQFPSLGALRRGHARRPVADTDQATERNSST